MDLDLFGFLGERCVLEGSQLVGSSDLYAAYVAWRSLRGGYVSTHCRFTQALRKLGLASGRMRLEGRQRRVIFGVALASPVVASSLAILRGSDLLDISDREARGEDCTSLRARLGLPPKPVVTPPLVEHAAVDLDPVVRTTNAAS